MRSASAVTYPHHVLDQHDRRALRTNAGDEVDRAVDLRRREARQHLVEHDESWTRGEPARQLEKLGLMQVEVARIRVRTRQESGELQPMQCDFRRMTPVERRAAEHRSERDVVTDGEVRERPRDLVGACHAGTRDPVRGQR